MDYKRIFLSKGLRGRIVYSDKANALMLPEEYERYKDQILNLTVYGTLEDLVESKNDE